MFGTRHTEEEKARISESSSGRKLTQEAKDKIGNAHKGKIVSSDTREKLSNVKTGKSLPLFLKSIQKNYEKQMLDQITHKPNN